nr:MAG TPA: hypothetical protein [Bacteriophage sp.]DAO57397.1 MAG TPA: hypothetical protein [Caudoviricetes sp.]
MCASLRPEAVEGVAVVCVCCSSVARWSAEVQPCAYIIKVKRKNNDKSKNNCKNI